MKAVQDMDVESEAIKLFLEPVEKNFKNFLFPVICNLTKISIEINKTLPRTEILECIKYFKDNVSRTPLLKNLAPIQDLQEYLENRPKRIMNEHIAFKKDTGISEIIPLLQKSLRILIVDKQEGAIKNFNELKEKILLLRERLEKEEVKNALEQNHILKANCYGTLHSYDEFINKINQLKVHVEGISFLMEHYLKICDQFKFDAPALKDDKLTVASLDEAKEKLTKMNTKINEFTSNLSKNKVLDLLKSTIEGVDNIISNVLPDLNKFNSHLDLYKS